MAKNIVIKELLDNLFSVSHYTVNEEQQINVCLLDNHWKITGQLLGLINHYKTKTEPYARYFPSLSTKC